MYTMTKLIIANKIPKSIKIFTIIITLLVISLIIVITNYQYNQYTNYLGYIGKEEEYYVVVYLEDDTIYTFQNAYLTIDDTKFVYEKIVISDEYYLYGNKEMRMVKLYGVLDEKYLIINNVINIKAKGEKTTLFKELKKGLGL